MGGRSYYETTPLTTDQLAAAFKSAQKQDDLVLAVFRAGEALGLGRLSASQVHAIGVKRGSHWLLTSVRRSISTLVQANVLVKTDDTRNGPHGMPERIWRLADHVISV